jgi:hypothetical protein
VAKTPQAWAVGLKIWCGAGRFIEFKICKSGSI